ncbi:MAG: aldo/keto reductase [Blastocatellia bacterium]|nr:MAG: aldo/keto reductase [Blastocatellia bacterium]
MEYRQLGRTPWRVSTISFGCWAIGGDAWGNVGETEALAALHRAVDLGVNFFDTADVYGDGRSEQLLAKLKNERNEEIIIATKAGRRLNPHNAAGYTVDNIQRFVERSLQNLSVDSIDLLQLHCPPTDVYYYPELFGGLDSLVAQGKLRYYGVSVQRIEEALKAIEYPNVQTVQIIFNIFRQRPADLFFEEAKKHDVGILARVPLSSGMLTGKLTSQSTFVSTDHRAYNRHGEAFDRGETFSGVDYDTSLAAVEELRTVVPPGISLTQFALRWILMFDAVTCAIPGAKNPAQVEENASAADIPPLSESTMKVVRDLYERRIRSAVHHLW